MTSPNSLLERREGNRELVLVISTDKGLCGPLNSNVLKIVTDIKTPAKYAVIGRKGAQFIARTKRDLLADFPANDRTTFADIKIVAEFMVKQFLDGVVDTVEVIWPRFRNTLAQVPTIMPILPLSSVKDVIADLHSDAGVVAAASPGAKAMDSQMLFEPDAASVLDALLPLYVNREIYPGEIVGLVGESGSGKTTVGRASIGLLPVKSGSIEIVGKEIAGADSAQLSAIRRHTGIVFQDPASSLNPRLPIGESIGEPLFLAGLAKGSELAHKVEDLLDQVELPRSYRNRYPHELSGGQRQRVGIARALALTPDLLIADEPTSALDVSVQARFLDLLQELQGKLNFACLFISHDLAVVDILSHRIAVMQNGLLVEEGDRDQILKNPKHDYTRRLISAVPVPDPKEQQARREARLANKK